MPAQCCHPTDVVNKKYAPRCIDILCTMVCSGPLDCGAGRVACVNNECGIIPSAVSATIDAPFQLAAGRQAIVSDGSNGIKIEFLKVTQDSRCPRDVQCVWAGQVSILVGVAVNGHGLGEFGLSPIGYGTPSSIIFDGYSLMLSEVQPPYPATIQEYAATFVLSKKG
jgi:hypothetical protein